MHMKMQILFLCVILFSANLILCQPSSTKKVSLSANAAGKADLFLRKQELQSSKKQYWFAPRWPDTTSSYNYMGLFASNAAWPHAADSISAFIVANPDQFTAVQLQQMMSFLKQHNIKFGVGAGPLIAGSCGQGVEGFSMGSWTFLHWVEIIENAGGTLDIIDFDEPYYFGRIFNGTNACHWSAVQIAQKLDTFMQEMRVRLPNVEFWDTEVMLSNDPRTDYNGYKNWLDTFKLVTGYPMPGFNVEFWTEQAGWDTQLKSMEDYSKQQGVPFGIMYNSSNPNTQNSNVEWIADAGCNIVKYEMQKGGTPDLGIFVSWVAKPDRMLPETQPGTFTNFIYSYFNDKANLCNINLTTHKFLGYLDTASCSNIAGWSYDTDDPTHSIQVSLFRDGAMGAGGVFVGSYAADVIRPDVNASYNYGFSIPTPVSLKDGASHTIYIYGVNQNLVGSLFLVGTTTVQCSSPTSVDGINKNNSNITIIPNPFNQSATITIRSIEESLLHEMKIYDLLGNEVRSIRFTGKQTTVERGTLSDGVYFYKVISQNRNTVTGKFIINN